MKKLIISCFVLSVLSTLSAFIPKTVLADNKPRPRFEHILSEDAPNDEHAHFVVYHDRETGQELICYEHVVDVGRAPSCYLTGRAW